MNDEARFMIMSDTVFFIKRHGEMLGVRTFWLFKI